MGKLRMDEVMAVVYNDEAIGFCLACGAEHYGIEPDARQYECNECDQPKVYGAAEILMMLGA